MGAPSSLSLERLNDDVLTLIVHILDDLFGRKYLKSLSLTSKRLRSVCSPILFEKARINCSAPSPEEDPPRCTWPYVRTLEFTGDFATWDRLSYEDLQSVLPHLTALRTVRFVRFHMGLTWEDLQIALIAPNVRVLEIEETLEAWRPPFTFPDDTTSVTLPLTEFIYRECESGQHRNPGLALVNRWRYLDSLFLSLHHGLQVLHAPSTMVPLSEMAAVDWPRLRELKLYGDNYHTEDPTIFARLCARMPLLRVLDLHLRHKASLSQTCICTSSIAPSFDYLETVFLPYPDPNDTFYARLPSTLRHLHLVDSPRYYHFKVQESDVIYNYATPTLVTSTDLLHILKQLQGPLMSLRALEVAFKADKQDQALFAYVNAAFPNLCTLQIHRYRSRGESRDDIESVVRLLAQNLSALCSLRHIRIYLDLPDDDDAFVSTLEDRYDRSRAVGQFLDSLGHFATILAQACGPTLQTVDTLSAAVFEKPVWMRWDVSRDDQGRPVLDCQSYRCLMSDDYADNK